jgi:hypothetical protein
MSPEQSIKNSCCENEHLAAENRILRGQIKGRPLLSDGEKATLAEIAHLSVIKIKSAPLRWSVPLARASSEWLFGCIGPEWIAIDSSV